MMGSGEFVSRTRTTKEHSIHWTTRDLFESAWALFDESLFLS
jgi:hypothetical protein